MGKDMYKCVGGKGKEVFDTHRDGKWAINYLNVIDR